MMGRCTSALLVAVMLLASGRLLACGWECIDELAAPAAAPCHEDSGADRDGLPAVALAKVGGAAHACQPELAEPRVTVAKPASAHALSAAPPVAVGVTANRLAQSSGHHRHPFQLRFEPAPLPAPAVLRI